MRICDICKENEALYNTYAYTKRKKGKQVEMCRRCYTLYNKIHDAALHVAYKKLLKRRGENAVSKL